MTRYLRRDRVRAGVVWEEARGEVRPSAEGCLVFDDGVLGKNHSREMGLVYRQYSGNEHRGIRGIGLVSCVHVNPESGGFWVIDYHDPEADGKSKQQHVAEMYRQCLGRHRQGELDFRAVLMDAWYGSTELMLPVRHSGSVFYCPVKPNRASARPNPGGGTATSPREPSPGRGRSWTGASRCTCAGSPRAWS